MTAPAGGVSYPEEGRLQRQCRAKSHHFADGVAATKLVIHSQPGPAILVGHSYGGVVIAEAGTGPNVAGLVYITVSAPDAGESVNTLIANPPPCAPVPPILPPTEWLSVP